MIYPTFEELSKDGKYNRYTIAMAVAKGARMVTEEYLEEREYAEEMIRRKATDKPLAAMIDKELRDEKAVRTSVHRLRKGEYVIDEEPSQDGKAPTEGEGASEEE